MGSAAGQAGRGDAVGGSGLDRGPFPEGACSCGRDLADAADLGVTRSFQQEEIPAGPAERVQHDLPGAQLVQDLHPHDRGPKGTRDAAGSTKRVLPGLAIDGPSRHTEKSGATGFGWSGPK